MKKTIVYYVALLLGISNAMADEVIVNNVTLPQGGVASLHITLNNPERSYTAGQMALILPEGISAVLDGNGDPQITKGERFVSTNHSIGASHLQNGKEQFTIFSINSSAITGTEGSLFSIGITAENALELGSILEGQLIEIEFTTTDGERTLFNNQTFTITVGEPLDTHVLLDETSTSMPVSSDEVVDVILNRTIKAGEWNTICLPFTVTGEQLKAAYGEDVELAAFTAWASEEDDDGAVVAINVTFSSVDATDGIEANTPMLIKVSETVTTATFDGVTIEPDEEPVVQVGKKASQRGYFYGTYVRKLVPEENLFLNGNKFYYSTGNTTIKGYRGYFELRDVLDAYYDVASVKFNCLIDDIVTNVDGITDGTSNGTCFDLSGRRITKPQHRGIYIINGNKVMVK